MSLGNGAWKEGGGSNHTEPNVQGIYDNPVSGNHQAPSHWKTVETKILTKYLPNQEGLGGLGVRNQRKTAQ